MPYIKSIVIMLTAVAAAAMQACRHQGHRPSYTVTGDTNAVYYWRTELRLDSLERRFLSRHHVSKCYCRYFDVVMDSVPTPNATLTFTDTLPAGVQLVPTVFITEDCMHRPHPGLARRLVRRIMQMNATNDAGPLSELQIDCDYTARSRNVYYDFLREVRSELAAAQAAEGQRQPGTAAPPVLSATIRLHQLQMAPPPADYGVLMLYNTGDPRRLAERDPETDTLRTRNPVLEMRDVAPYLSHLDGYPLPLFAAYPVYRWQRNICGVRVEHTVSADEILRVKKAVEQQRGELRHGIVVYHLDKENIQRYEPDTYEEIYRH